MAGPLPQAYLISPALPVVADFLIAEFGSAESHCSIRYTG
jgi:hypothetical protein